VRTRPTILFYSAGGGPVPEPIGRWIDGKGVTVVATSDAATVEALALRSLPLLLLVEGDAPDGNGLALCQRLKADPFTAIVPVAVLAGRHGTDDVQRWFEAGADEYLSPLFEPAERRRRLDALLIRTERGMSVQPSTRLPGSSEIEREIRRWLESGQIFAVCYADLDYFKEFNDRYSYYEGDRVIVLVSRILHDVVKGLLGGGGFVGHIGGDDFICVMPLGRVNEVCTEILDVFDAIIPYQYSEQDRRAGYYFGKDRRGQLHQVPLMTLSIGIVTNEHRRFTHPAQVSELATEMKAYAKTLPGSVFVVDRRHDPAPDEERP